MPHNNSEYHPSQPTCFTDAIFDALAYLQVTVPPEEREQITKERVKLYYGPCPKTPQDGAAIDLGFAKEVAARFGCVIEAVRMSSFQEVLDATKAGPDGQRVLARMLVADEWWGQEGGLIRHTTHIREPQGTLRGKRLVATHDTKGRVFHDTSIEVCMQRRETDGFNAILIRRK